MLTALHIQDFVLIDQLSVALGSGLTAMTGETGAGKSILLEALGLAAGGRVGRASVRPGAARGVVTASFELPGGHPVWAILEENGVAAADDEVILRRVQGVDGKSRAFINDQPVSVGLLRAVGETLVEIHGQHDGQSFLTVAAHRGLLDAFAGIEGRVAEIEAIFRQWREAIAACEARRAAHAQAAREADYLRHVTAELKQLAPEEGEEARLAARRAELMAAEKIAGDLSAALAALSEEGLEGQLSAAARRLARAGAAFAVEHNPLANALDRIDRALSEIMEARAATEDAAERLGVEDGALEEVEDRLFALRAAARKHGVAPDALPAVYARALSSLADVDAGDVDLRKLESAAAAAASLYRKSSAALTKAREAAASRLDAAVAAELEPLKLGKAKFRTHILSNVDEPRADGVDQVEFMVATNPGAPFGPLKTIASGGELSRFVLAMKAALAAAENRTVIIFDEVDAGVGGAVADAVGERLARLGEAAQVLVVTHSPQVAARAGAHWRVEKTETDAASVTRVRPLEPGERIEEIARMLSGAVVTSEARAAARRLLGVATVADKPPRKRRMAAG